MSLFDALEDAVSAECDALFGEKFTTRPMVGGANVKAAPDPDRVPVQFTGIFDERGMYHEASAGGLTDFKRISVGRDDTAPTISVDDNELARLDRKPRDLVVRLKTGKVYEIARAVPDGMGRTVLKLRFVEAA